MRRLPGPLLRRPSRLAALALLVCGLTIAAPRGDAAGEIAWFNLLTEDVDAASAFYTGLLGWEVRPTAAGTHLVLRDGIPFSGIGEIEDRLPDAPESLWLAAIDVAEIDEAVAAARRRGATIHEDVTRLPGWGRYAILQDPEGAPFQLVAPERPIGGTRGYAGWRWAELWTSDTDAAADFYSAVVGYDLERIERGGAPYSTFSRAGRRDAGLVKLDNEAIAPRWMPYVGVSDLRAILVRVWRLGGRVLREPAELDFPAAGANRVALIADPTGAALFLYQLDARAAVDPVDAARAQTPRSADTAEPSSRDDPRLDAIARYGFGPSWGTVFPTFPQGPFGPIPY